ncbi:PLP-dependent aminotransferase family protein [Synoicihabitans lomoniglobus]|uniref:PLP-dependent aminotransferase family protein n=1 Tax=Synoicihabitans lomoniglobus TaxID=2909285 RepID=A0AAF0CQP1_9BACT|nr:PLP-dependent aminotransferase family protein [Opitutaceae bacterium LMO-M01]WED66310.1 PLP-dependent aminotransferase family protein [Opitutaceae bacterium LMO-M01]
MAETSRISFSALGQRAAPPTIAKLMAMALENPELLSIAAGFTDNSTLPVEQVRHVVNSLADRDESAEYLQYGSNHGRPGLRKLLSEHLCRSETALDYHDVQRGCFITNGSQQALYLAMQVLCNPGDIVLVDRPSYFVFLEMLKGLGIEAKSIPVDDEGVVDGPALAALVDSLRASGDAERIKAVYFVSYYSNPSGRSLTRDEKATIATVLTAAEVVVPVIEDAAYRDIYYREPWPAPSVLTMAEWADFPKLYTSTLTKPFSTGLKVGFATCTDVEWRAKMLHVKAHHDFGTANFNQRICEEVLADGGLDRQLQRIRPAYEAKMRALDGALREGGLLELGWQWAEPAGGLYLWLTAPDGIDTGLESDFCHACVAAGVLYVPGELCFGDVPPRSCIRLSFGVLGQTQLHEAARRLVSVAHRFADVSETSPLSVKTNLDRR